MYGKGVRVPITALLTPALILGLNTSARAQECGDVVAEIFSGAEAFHAEADRTAVIFVGKEYLKAYQKPLKKALEQEGRRLVGREPDTYDYVDAGKTLWAWSKQVKTWSGQLDDVVRCLDSGCSLVDLLKSLNEGLRQWLKSLPEWMPEKLKGAAGRAAAAKRVDQFAKWFEGYSSRLEGEFERNARLAVACGERWRQKVTKGDPVPLDRPQARSTPKPKSGGGMDAGMALLGGLAAVVFGVAALKAIQQSQPDGSGGCGSCNAGSCLNCFQGQGYDNVCCPGTSPVYCTGTGRCYTDIAAASAAAQRIGATCLLPARSRTCF